LIHEKGKIMSPQKSDSTAKPIKGKLVLTRIFNAPPELVFKAWTDPKHMAQWWGPKMFTTPVCKMDVRVGGALHIVMRGPNGAEYGMTGVFDEVVKPKLLTFTAEALDANGTPALRVHTSATFTAHGKKTKLTLRTEALGLIPAAVYMIGGMKVGWSQSLIRLRELLAKRI
jgi:uncharacterized protein YndB with AHSA1/START domain